MTDITKYSIIKFMGLSGFIVINHFGVPGQSVLQAERLKEEFLLRGVNIKTVPGGALKAGITGGALSSAACGADFAVYLDKDKYLSAVLEGLGIRLFNRHTPIRLCDDKGETCLALAGAGLNLPDTVFAPLCYDEHAPLDKEYLSSVADRLGYPLIVKESYGSMGKGVYLAENFERLTEVCGKIKTKPHIFQQYFSLRRGTDMRVIVIGGRARAAMLRINENDFRSNIARGGRGETADISAPENKEFIRAAERAARALELDYCGVDLLFGNNGEPVICEVNSNAFFNGIESVTGVNIAAQYAEYIIETVKRGKSR